MLETRGYGGARLSRSAAFITNDPQLERFELFLTGNVKKSGKNDIKPQCSSPINYSPEA